MKNITLNEIDQDEVLFIDEILFPYLTLSEVLEDKLSTKGMNLYKNLLKLYLIKKTPIFDLNYRVLERFLGYKQETIRTAFRELEHYDLVKRITIEKTKRLQIRINIDALKKYIQNIPLWLLKLNI